MRDHHYYFSASLSYADCEELYLSHIKSVIVTSDDGKRIQLPKEHLKRFITPSGIKGRFRVETDRNHKIKSINLLND